MKRLVFPILALMLAMLACNVPTPTVTIPPATLPPATLPPVSGGPTPAGYFVAPLVSPPSLEFDDLSGATIGTLSTPSLENAFRGSAIPVGAISGTILPPVV
jgi:hypothetical protein